MIVEIDDWKFDVDLGNTMAYSAAEAAEHCHCGYCRNFYKAVDGSYPDLRPFLARFGLDIEGPEQLWPFEPTLYLADYSVKGSILRLGSKPISANGVSVTAQKGTEATETWTEYFILSVGPFSLPWVLDEPMNEVLSPANEPSFLEKMWGRLLRLLPNTSNQ